MHRTFFLFFIVGSTMAMVGTGCNDKSAVIERYNPDLELKERFSINLADSTKLGVYQAFYESGKLYEEAIYRNDTLIGERILYFENGNKKVVEQRNEKGVFDGTYQSFHENGQLEMEGRYVNGMMSGKWKKYYNSGQLEEVVTMRDNYENGPFVEYYENGNLKAEGHYKDGDHEDGLLKLYDTSGELIRKMECDRGICQTIWKRD